MRSLFESRCRSRHGLLLVVTAAVLWGTVGVSSKILYAMTATTPLSVGFFRLAFAVPALLGLSWLTQGSGMLRIERRDLLLMSLMGLMTALYQVCYFSAVERIGVAVATLLTLCSAPVIVALLSLIWCGEKPARNVLIALALAVAGTSLLAWPAGEAGRGAIRMGGYLLALGSAFGYAVVAMVSRSLSGRNQPLQTIAISFTVGALVLAAFVSGYGLSASFTLSGWGLLVYLGLIPTALAYVLFITGIRHTTATAASVCTLVEPLASTVLAWLIFGERLGAAGGIGALLMCCAMGFLFAPRRKRTSIATSS